MPRYAENTEVGAERSRQEIEKTLQRYGARSFMYGFDEHRAMVMFAVHGRKVRFVLPVPDREDKEFKWTNHDPPRRRTLKQQEDAHEQAVRQRWRALNLVIKAKLEAVETGIVSFDAEFLAHLVLPNGSTVADTAIPAVQLAYETNTMTSLLPDYDGPKSLTSSS